MAFVRSKKVNGNEYFQVVRNYREGGKHKQEVLHHLGLHRSVEEAIEYRRHQLEAHLRIAASFEEEAEATKEYLLDFYGIQVDAITPAVAKIFDSEDELLDTWNEWDEEVRRKYRRVFEEFGPLEGFVDYYQAKNMVEFNKQQSAFLDAKLRELLIIKEKYF